MKNIQVAALAGGVGGARMANGLAALLPPEQLSIIVNTGDDFIHWGLQICPDLDTVLYNLAGKANPATGWGLKEESFACLEATRELGGEAWFRLGDRDLATHLRRTQLINNGLTLSEATRQLAESMGVMHPILPMSDTPCPTIIITPEEELDFQTYFVQRRCEPRVSGLRWENDQTALATPRVLEALQKADLIIFCPSNPFVSIDPVLNRPGVREIVQSKPCLAVSPILGGKVVKGPAAKMFAELGVAQAPSALDVARYYQDLLDGFVLDTLDKDLAPEIQKMGFKAGVMPTMMLDIETQKRTARDVLAFAQKLLGEQS